MSSFKRIEAGSLKVGDKVQAPSEDYGNRFTKLAGNDQGVNLIVDKVYGDKTKKDGVRAVEFKTERTGHYAGSGKENEIFTDGERLIWNKDSRNGVKD